VSYRAHLLSACERCVFSRSSSIGPWRWIWRLNNKMGTVHGVTGLRSREPACHRRPYVGALAHRRSREDGGYWRRYGVRRAHRASTARCTCNAICRRLGNEKLAIRRGNQVITHSGKSASRASKATLRHRWQRRFLVVNSGTLVSGGASRPAGRLSAGLLVHSWAAHTRSARTCRILWVPQCTSSGHALERGRKPGGAGPTRANQKRPLVSRHGC